MVWSVLLSSGSRPPRSAASIHALLVALALAAAPGCSSPVQRIGVALFYEHAPLGASHVERDLRYRSATSGAPEKHQLDLFHPPANAVAGTRWPLLVFVHGGGWSSGDRQLAVGGADVYANIGRFFAARGIGTAVISYRLQPQFAWRDQVEDVAAAVQWLRANIAKRGGDPDAVFLSGHSAGAHLGMRLALDRAWLARAAIPAQAICGLMPVSGAAYDLADAETYALGASPSYFAKRFRPEDADQADGDWQRDASVVPLVRALGRAAPPTLIVYARGETADLVRQSERLAEVMREAGAPSKVLALSGESHQRMVLTISRPDKAAGPAMAEFVHAHAGACSGA